MIIYIIIIGTALIATWLDLTWADAHQNAMPSKAVQRSVAQEEEEEEYAIHVALHTETITYYIKCRDSTTDTVQ